MDEHHSVIIAQSRRFSCPPTLMMCRWGQKPFDDVVADNASATRPCRPDSPAQGVSLHHPTQPPRRGGDPLLQAAAEYTAAAASVSGEGIATSERATHARVSGPGGDGGGEAGCNTYADGHSCRGGVTSAGGGTSYSGGGAMRHSWSEGHGQRDAPFWGGGGGSGSNQHSQYSSADSNGELPWVTPSMADGLLEVRRPRPRHMHCHPSSRACRASAKLHGEGCCPPQHHLLDCTYRHMRARTNAVPSSPHLLRAGPVRRARAYPVPGIICCMPSTRSTGCR